jgi:hypothetical protein
MERSEFEALCIECARDLEASYGKGLVESVHAELAGQYSGRSRNMGTLSVGDITSIASLIVSMASLVVAYITMKHSQKSSGDMESGAVTPAPGAAPKPAAPAELPEMSADVPRATQALDEAVDELGDQQRTVAIRVKVDFCAWLTRRSTR